VAYSTPRIAAIEYLRVVMLPTVEQVRTIDVLGTGTMGHGIAHVGALMGAQVHLYDAMRGAAQAGIAKIAKNLDRGIELGKLQQTARDAAFARITAFDELTSVCAQVDCVIEAAPEQLDLKRDLFGSLDKIASSHALLAPTRPRCRSARSRRPCAIRAGSSACTSSTPCT